MFVASLPPRLLLNVEDSRCFAARCAFPQQACMCVTLQRDNAVFLPRLSHPVCPFSPAVFYFCEVASAALLGAVLIIDMPH